MSFITVAGDYQADGEFMPPDTDGLDYWGLFGTNAAFSARNHAPGQPGAAVVGAPGLSAGYATFTPGSKFVQTQALQKASQTLMTVVRVQDEVNHHLISNFNSPPVESGAPSPARGIALSLNQGSSGVDNLLTIAFARSVKVGADDIAVNVSLVNSLVKGAWTCIAGRVNGATGELKVFNLTAGTSASIVNANPGNIGSAPLRIGSPYVTPVVPTNDQVCAIDWGVAKSDSQILESYTFLKAYCAAVFGIDI